MLNLANGLAKAEGTQLITHAPNSKATAVTIAAGTIGIKAHADEADPGPIIVPTTPNIAAPLEKIYTEVNKRTHDLFPNPTGLPYEIHRQYLGYLKAMIKTFAQMDREDGLPMDTVIWVPDGNGKLKSIPVSTNTAPTDIGMKIAFNIGLYRFFDGEKVGALNQLSKMMDTLEKLPKDKETGLFFRMYGIRGAKKYKDFSPKNIGQDSEYPVYDADISAIDNWHSYLALWTLSKLKGAEIAPLAERAKKMIAKMSFANFYDPENNVISGNLAHKTALVPSPDNDLDLEEKPYWKRGQYSIGYNSEMRQLLVGGGYALKLFPNIPKDKLDEIVRKVKVELSPEKTLQVWQGGFQFSLSGVNLPEHISKLMQSSDNAMFDQVFKKDLQGIRLPDGKVIYVPKTPSATIAAIIKMPNGDYKVDYEANYGNQKNVESGNRTPVHDNSTAVHATLELAAIDPIAAAPLLKKLEGVRGKNSPIPLYNEENGGWFAASRLTYEDETKQIATAENLLGQPAADGYFTGTSLLKMLAPDRLGVTARGILEDEEASVGYLEGMSKLDFRETTRRILSKAQAIKSALLK